MNNLAPRYAALVAKRPELAVKWAPFPDGPMAPVRYSLLSEETSEGSQWVVRNQYGQFVISPTDHGASALIQSKLLSELPRHFSLVKRGLHNQPNWQVKDDYDELITDNAPDPLSALFDYWENAP